MSILNIFTDGACSGNPGPGGWGAIVVDGNKRTELSGHKAQTTNNQMEMQAVISALQSIKTPSTILITTDSKYVIDGFNQWLPNWIRRGWRTASGSPVKNEDLWRELKAAAAPHTLTWRWVKGHNGHPENERADKLAVDARMSIAK